MRLLYSKYYKEKQRGFTDAEFQYACHQIAGTPLSDVFEYLYSTKEIDYDRYLKYAGLKLVLKSVDVVKKEFALERI